jgi:NAD(P)-dependent dehydrogenase (short-subunit alcohol dehydrogenase family)
MDRVGLPVGAALRPGELGDRVVLVSGATGGLGRPTALALGAAGATVVLLGRRVAKLEVVYDALVAAGAPTPAIYPLDLEGATPADYDQAVEAIARDCGRLDGVLHAAAQFGGLVPFAQVEPLEWVRSLHVNLGAVALLTRACLPLLQRATDAALVYVLDPVAQPARAFWGPYAAAKRGLEGMVESLAQEFESGPLRIHALAPGPLRTPLRARAWFAEDPAAVATPDATASACAWLFAPAAAPLRNRTLDLAGG